MSAPEKENIWVGIRARPLNYREQKEGQKKGWSLNTSAHELTQLTAKGEIIHNSTSSYDEVFDEEADNEQVYNNVAKRVVTGTTEGVHGTVFAYGQTSSGKTHTMKGIIDHSIKDIFTIIKKDPSKIYTVTMTYVEIYNEVIRDLLDTTGEKTNLKVHEDLKRGVFIGNLTENKIGSEKDLARYFKEGEGRRHIGCTAMNARSSRSHCILTLAVHSDQADESEGGRVLSAKLHLVDLAGSERHKDTQAKGLRLKEGSHINKSLLTLGSVIRKLAESSKSSGGVHIPFRDSKLTRILQPALGGNTRTSIICCITQAIGHCEETLSTLGFAARAKLISNKVIVNEVVEPEEVIKRLTQENKMLKRRLKSTADGPMVDRKRGRSNSVAGEGDTVMQTPRGKTRGTKRPKSSVKKALDENAQWESYNEVDSRFEDMMTLSEENLRLKAELERMTSTNETIKDTKGTNDPQDSKDENEHDKKQDEKEQPEHEHEPKQEQEQDSELRAQNEDLRNQLQGLRETLHTMTKELDTLRADKQSKQAWDRSMGMLKLKHRDEQSKLQEKLDDEIAKNQELEGELELLRSYTKGKSSYAALDSQLRKAEEEALLATQELAELRGVVANSGEEQASFKVGLEEKETALEALNKELSDARESLASHQEKREEQAREAEAVREAYEEEMRISCAFQSQIQGIAKQLRESRSVCEDLHHRLAEAEETPAATQFLERARLMSTIRGTRKHTPVKMSAVASIQTSPCEEQAKETEAVREAYEEEMRISSSFQSQVQGMAKQLRESRSVCEDLHHRLAEAEETPAATQFLERARLMSNIRDTRKHTPAKTSAVASIQTSPLPAAPLAAPTPTGDGFVMKKSDGVTWLDLTASLPKRISSVQQSLSFTLSEVESILSTYHDHSAGLEAAATIRVDELTGELKGLRDELNQTLSVSKVLEEHLSSSTYDRTILKCQLAALFVEHNAMVVQHNDVKQKMEDKLKLAGGRLVRSNKNLGRMMKEVERLSSLVESSKAQQQEQHELVVSLQSTIKAKEMELERGALSHTQTLSAKRDLEQHLSSSTHGRTILKCQLADLSVEHNYMKQKMEKMEKKLKLAGELHKKLKAIQENAANLRATLEGTHAESLAQLQQEHEIALSSAKEENDRALAKMSEQHVVELSSASDENESAIAKMKQEHMAALSAVTGETNALAKMQEDHAMALSGVKDENERTLAEMQKEHAAALSSVKDDNENMLAKMKEEHATALSSVKDENESMIAEMKQEHHQALSSVKDENEDVVTKMKEENEAANQKAASAVGELETARARVEELMNQLETQRDEPAVAAEAAAAEAAKALAQLQEEHAMVLSSVKDENERMLSKMKEEHATALSSVKDGNESMIAEMSEQHAAALSGVKDENEGMVAKMKEEHAAALSSVKDDNESTVQQMKEEHATVLTRVKNENDRTLAEVSEQHAAVLSGLKDEHESMLAKMREESEASKQKTASLLSELGTTRARVEELSGELGATHNRVEELSNQLKTQGSQPLAAAEAAAAEAAKFKNRAAKLSERYSKVQKEKQGLKGELKKMQNECELLRTTVTQKTKLLEEAETELVEKEKENTALAKKIPNEKMLMKLVAASRKAMGVGALRETKTNVRTPTNVNPNVTPVNRKQDLVEESPFKGAKFPKKVKLVPNFGKENTL